jgi:hypothetical protein
MSIEDDDEVSKETTDLSDSIEYADATSRDAGD